MQIPTLYYIHDPMCSWCWAFKPIWHQVEKALNGKVDIRYILGGLAADTDQPMSPEMQQMIQNTWQRIQQEIPDTKFNFDFWHNCKPRRSTYPACRAVIAAGMQDKKQTANMLLSIQHAYYLHAKNPSDNHVLIQLAQDIGLDCNRFEQDIFSQQCKRLLDRELQFCSSLGVNSFPSIVLNDNESNTLIHIDYNKSDTIVSSISKLLS